MVAVFGTMAAGILHVYMGIPYVFSATIYAVAVTVILFCGTSAKRRFRFTASTRGEQRKNRPRQLACSYAYRLLVTQLPAAADTVSLSSFAKA